MKPNFIFTSTLVLCLVSTFAARAQMPVPPPAPEVELRSPEELDQLLGPIALYPDPLIAEILPAATLPSQIVMADRYLASGGDPNASDQQGWDPSVAALTRYPTVLKWLDDNLEWTTALGQAFLAQQQDVMDSIQRLRAQAQTLGNLQSTPQENVFTDDGAIDILPANPEVIYVPVYQPALVYYQRPYGTPFISFGVACAIGSWLNHDFDWHAHHLLVWHRDAPRPANWWTRRPSERPRAEQHETVWQPRKSRGQPSRQEDRGWGSPPPRSTVTVIGAPSKPVERRAPFAPAQRPPERRAPEQKPAPAPVQRSTPTPPSRPAAPAQAPRPAAPASRPASGALIGVESSRETRQFSSRGQVSRQTTVSRPAAAPARSEPPAHSAPAPRPQPSKPAAGPGKR